ncbi:hypothetical protein C8D88_13016 [Lentzea atacamensis]|uniref:Uncharacterized protein n=1 Tax=Lentzea atacamensis TaxID=531938 RepID=A0A316H9V9_9PSEU|nr:hypothetical protein C8D88_13016 [Lentzea atacamensis]
MVTINDILDGQTVLDIECLDRIYPNLYVPTLQVGGQVMLFLWHRGFPIISPAYVGQIGQRSALRNQTRARGGLAVVFQDVTTA